MRRLFILLAYSFLVTGITARVHAQSAESFREAGHYYIDIFEPNDYQAYTQNWAIAQTENGLLYFGNTYGVLEYDGVFWKLIPVTNNTLVRALAKGKDGRIYVGAREEFGVLAPDSVGSLRYHSLLGYLTEDKRDLGDTQVASAHDGIYFLSGNRLFRYNNQRMDHWSPESWYKTIFTLRDTLYADVEEIGLMKMVGDSLQPIPGGYVFSDKDVQSIHPKGATSYLVVTRAHGLYQCTTSSCQPFGTPDVSAQLSRMVPYHRNSMLADSTLVLGTFRGGIAMLNPSGEIMRILTQDDGLPSNTAVAAFIDQEEALWIASDQGIARLSTGLRVTYFDKRSGLIGLPVNVSRHRGRLYVATTRGLFTLKRSVDGGPATFEQLTTFRPCWSALPVGASVLASCANRILDVATGTAALTLPQNLRVDYLHRSRADSTYLYIGSWSRLARARQQDDQWVYDDQIDLTHDFRAIAEDGAGHLWFAGVQGHGIAKLEPSSTFAQSQITHFDTTHGVGTVYNEVAHIEDRAYVVSYERGVLTMRNQGDSTWFEPVSTINAFEQERGNKINAIHPDASNRLWLAAGTSSGIATLHDDGTYSIEPSPIRRATLEDTFDMYPEGDNIMWVAGSSGVIRVEMTNWGSVRSSIPVLIRSITTRNDSLLFGGTLSGLESAPIWSSTINSLRFEFASPRYEASRENLYRVKLDGVDDQWSNWHHETTKDYTNLTDGHYVFHVQVKDIKSHVSEETTFRFSILPPWYRTSWAYALWFLLGSGSIVGLVLAYNAYKTRQLKADNLALEQKVAERTRSLKEALQDAEVANQTKSTFLANISHEFRTPLMLILAPLADLIEARLGTLSNEALDTVKMIQRNAERLSNLIDELLDLSKLEAGKLDSQQELQDLIPLLTYLHRSFSLLADQKNIDFQFRTEEDQLIFTFDAAQIERVFANLLSNAFKYTAAEGTILLQVSISKEKNEVKVCVRDSGSGIAKEQIPHIFDRFYSTQSSTLEPGTGIGLAYAQDLIELHNGRISVESEQGFGSTFTVCLPLYREFDTREFLPANYPDSRYVQAEVRQLMNVHDEPPEPRSQGEDKKTILVVDDEIDVLNYICSKLRPTYNVIEAIDGLDALNQVRMHVPDLVICDLMMPKMDGLAFTKAVRANRDISYIPVILLTANTARKLEGLEHGATDYLSKPFDWPELSLRIQNIFNSHKRLLEKFANARQTLALTPIDATSEDAVFLARVNQIVEEHMGDDTFNVEVLADHIGQSRSTLHRRVKELLDQSPSELIRDLRLQRAHHFLEMRVGTISEIAYSVGFKSVSHFSKAFRNVYGKPPSAVKQG